MRKELVTSYGLSTLAATEMLASIQDFLIPMGVARKEATGLSGDFVKLARDLGSFNNQPTEEVLVAMKSALSGIAMPMKRFGVDVSEAGLQQQLMNEGVNKSVRELTRAEKAQLIYRKVVADSSDAIGDFKRTSDSFANTLVSIKAVGQDVTLILGQEMMSALAPTVKEFGAFLKTEEGMMAVANAGRGIVTAFLILKAAIVTVWNHTKFYIDTAVAGFKSILGIVKNVKEKGLKQGLIDGLKGVGEESKQLAINFKENALSIANEWVDTGKKIKDLWSKQYKFQIQGINDVVSTTDAGMDEIDTRMALSAQQQKEIDALLKEALKGSEDELLQKKIEALQTYLAEYQLSADQQKEISAAVTAFEEEQAEKKKKAVQGYILDTLNGMSDMAGSLTKLSGDLLQTEINKYNAIDEADTAARKKQAAKITKFAKVDKALKIVQTIIETAVAAQRAFAALAGIPIVGPALGGAAAIAATAAGMGRVRLIKRQPLPSFKKGTTDTDEGIAYLHAGERVVPRNLNQPGISNASYAAAAMRGLDMGRSATYNQNTSTNNQKYITISGITVQSNSADNLLAQLEQLAENTNTRMLAR